MSKTETDYPTSTDYNLLWNLIHQGVSVPAFVYSNIREVACYNGSAFIGNTLCDNEADFQDKCTRLSLKFIAPGYIPRAEIEARIDEIKQIPAERFYHGDAIRSATLKELLK